MFVAGQRRLHPVDVAQRAPRVGGARLVAEVLVHQRGAAVVARLPQQRAGAPERSAFELGERGAAAAGCQRLRGRHAERRQLVGLVFVRGLVVGRLAVFSRARRARQCIHEHFRGGVEIGQRYVGDLSLAAADGAEQRCQGLPVLFTAQAADQADEVAAAENRQLGIERAPSGTHPGDATV